MHTTAAPVSLLAIYIVYRDLPENCRPCHIVRHEGLTLVMVDPGSLRLDVHAYCIDRLTLAEHNALRRALNQPAVGAGPMSDAVMEGRAYATIPPSLQLPTPPRWDARAVSATIRRGL